MSDTLPLRQLGGTGVIISPIGLGCWQFSQGKGIAGKYWPYLENDEIGEIVRVSLENGVNWFDTAEFYGHGKSEENLAAALHESGKSPGEVIIATKWWPLFHTAGNIPKTIGNRLTALNGFPIDLYQVHQPYAFSTTRAQIREMAKLVKTGKIRHVGVSNFSARRMRIAADELSRHGLRLASNQVRYSLLDRKIEGNGILETARELGATIIAYSPLAQGLLTGKFHDNPALIRGRSGPRKYLNDFKRKGLEKSRPVINALKEIAARFDATPAQVALNWLITSQGDTVVAIPGASSVDHARDNAAAMNFRLTEEETGRLEEISRDFK